MKEFYTIDIAGLKRDLTLCKLNESLYMINICDRRYEVIEKDFCGVCFMKNYILIAKDYPMEYFYKLIPPGKSTMEIVKFM